MQHNQQNLKQQLDTIAASDEKIDAVIRAHGYPAPRERENSFATMLRIIVSQQLSTKAAASIWERLEQLCGPPVEPQALLAQTEDALRQCGLSRQKIGYGHGLAERIVSGNLEPNQLEQMPTEQVIKSLTQIKGYGIWSAEIYAMFALGRADIFPAGDLALQIAVQRLDKLAEKPSEKLTREIAARWSPYQSAAAILMWHYYGAATLD